MMATLEERAERAAKRALAIARKPWLPTIAKVQDFSAKEGLSVELRNPGYPEYQIARLQAAGVRLVIYPHRTSASNQHARVRDENSQDSTRAAQLVDTLGFAVKNGRFAGVRPLARTEGGE